MEVRNSLLVIFLKHILVGQETKPRNVNLKEHKVSRLSSTVKRGNLKSVCRTSLVVQWLGICLPMQGTQEQQGKPPQWEAPTLQVKSSPCSLQESLSTVMNTQHSQKKVSVYYAHTNVCLADYICIQQQVCKTGQHQNSKWSTHLILSWASPWGT